MQLNETDMEKKFEQLMNRLNSVCQENTQMKEEIMKLKTHKINKKTIINNSNNNSNNNIQQNIHNEIKILAYGKEDLSYITNENYSLILNKGFKSIPHFIEYIHFNKDKPENQNIYISNMRDTHLLIFDGEKWQLKEKDDVLQNMIYNKSNIVK